MNRPNPKSIVEQPTAEQALHEIRLNATSPGSAMSHEGFEAALSRLPLAGQVIASTYALYPVAADQPTAKSSELVVTLNQLADDLDDMRGQDYRIGTSIVARVQAIARLAVAAGQPIVLQQLTELADELESMRGQDYQIGTSIVSRVRAIAHLAADTERDELLRGIRERAEDARRNREMYGKDSLSRHNRNEASAADVPWLLAEVARLGAVEASVRDVLYSHHPSVSEAVLAARRALAGGAQ